jgi:hypothetical protein
MLALPRPAPVVVAPDGRLGLSVLSQHSFGSGPEVSLRRMTCNDAVVLQAKRVNEYQRVIFAARPSLSRLKAMLTENTQAEPTIYGSLWRPASLPETQTISRKTMTSYSRPRTCWHWVIFAARPSLSRLKAMLTENTQAEPTIRSDDNWRRPGLRLQDDRVVACHPSQ